MPSFSGMSFCIWNVRWAIAMRAKFVFPINWQFFPGDDTEKKPGKNGPCHVFGWRVIIRILRFSFFCFVYLSYLKKQNDEALVAGFGLVFRDPGMYHVLFFQPHECFEAYGQKEFHTQPAKATGNKITNIFQLDRLHIFDWQQRS
jgi:hypothetical protein